jgi:hypothetical protein
VSHSSARLASGLGLIMFQAQETYRPFFPIAFLEILPQISTAISPLKIEFNIMLMKQFFADAVFCFSRPTAILLLKRL